MREVLLGSFDKEQGGAEVFSLACFKSLDLDSLMQDFMIVISWVYICEMMEMTFE